MRRSGGMRAAADAGPSGRRHSYIHDTDELRRIVGDTSRLLGNKDIFPQQGGIVDVAVDVFPLELYVCRSLHLLAPESVE